MRIAPKPAAASAAATFLLLLILDLTWPGHGVWLLIVGIMIGLAAAVIWWRDHSPLQASSASATPTSPFSDVGAYGLSGAVLQSSRRSPTGVPLAAVLAPISALAILLFIGGALGSASSDIEEAQATVIEQNVTAIDRSRDGEPQTPEVVPPTTTQAQHSQDTTTVTTGSVARTSAASAEPSSEAQPSTAPVKPIAVAAPRAADAPADEEEAVVAVPQSANTFEYIVEEGDTLYDIALRHDSTVEAIMALNKLDGSSFIHPGDVLLIPLSDDEES